MIANRFWGVFFIFARTLGRFEDVKRKKFIKPIALFIELVNFLAVPHANQASSSMKTLQSIELWRLLLYQSTVASSSSATRKVLSEIVDVQYDVL